MAGARCPTKVSTQQLSVRSAWSPARPSPASSVISQKIRSDERALLRSATSQICHPQAALLSSLKKRVMYKSRTSDVVGWDPYVEFITFN